MLRKLLDIVGLGAARPSAIKTTASYAPYRLAAANQIYNLLFCDDSGAFKPKPGETPAPWQAVLFSEPVAVQSVAALAGDTTAEGRTRALAYNWLRTHGHPVPSKQLLGVVVEVPLAGGLDVLAAFSDGGVRYINQTGKLAVLEGVPSIKPTVARLLEASEAVVARIGPWDKPRLPPPSRDRVRLTFLVSDGLYFGEGPMSVMEREQLAGPVIQQAAQLLQLIVAAATK